MQVKGAWLVEEVAFLGTVYLGMHEFNNCLLDSLVNEEPSGCGPVDANYNRTFKMDSVTGSPCWDPLDRSVCTSHDIQCSGWKAVCKECGPRASMDEPAKKLLLPS